MKIKKIDISSIFPIIINKIKKILELVSRLLKSIIDKLCKLESVVFVKVRIDNLKALSKSILSNNKTPVNKNKLIKNEINIKNENFIFSLFILFSEYKIFSIKE